MNNLNYSNLHHLFSSDVTWHSETFIHVFVFGRKQKLHLSKVKSAILQLNTRSVWLCLPSKFTNLLTYWYYLGYFREEYDVISFGVRCSRCTNDTPKPTNTSESKNVLQAIWADLPQGPINAAIPSFRKRLHACKKQPVDILNMLSELTFNMSCFFTITTV